MVFGLEALLSVFAPHECLGCGWEGSLLCRDCLPSTLPSVLPSCYRCHNVTRQGLVCGSCLVKTPLDGLKARTLHDGVAQQLIHALKFERAVAAAKPIASAMATLLPANIKGVLVVPVPTASSRVRQRGYDQAALLARYIAQQRDLSYKRALRRLTQTRQVGATRRQRLVQLQDAFMVPRSMNCVGKTIILVDDVLTTGSTLEATAGVLKAAGVARVYGLVFAWQQ